MASVPAQYMLRAVLLLAVVCLILYAAASSYTCVAESNVCPDGSIVPRSGPHCEFICAADNTIRAAVLWNAPLHSWTGIASEAVDFLVPLARRLPHLALVGGYVDAYIAELPVLDQTRLATLRERGEKFSKQNADMVHIYLTQYDPGSYAGDATRHGLQDFDYRIGRAMFETTLVPAAWKGPMKTMDEIWVPSTWGADRFVAAGLSRENVFVVPEAIDTAQFDPDLVPRNRSILPGSEGRFAFLSVFKWEERKGWDVLLTAYLTTFTASDNVALYIRASGHAGSDPKYDYDMLLLRLKIAHPPKVVFLPKVSMREYLQLYRAADAFVLATHAEGWGRPLMEAMAMGLPTIAPAWSGQTEFMTDRTSFLVPTTGLEPAFSDLPQIINYEKGHEWAALSPASFAKVMRYVYEHRSMAVSTGRRAREHIITKYSREAVAKIVEDHLARVISRIRARRQPRRVQNMRHEG